MSTTWNVYVGVYVEVFYPEKTILDSYYKLCSHCNRKHAKPSVYCPGCGNKLEDVYVTVKESFYDFSERHDIEDLFMGVDTTDKNFIIGNFLNQESYKIISDEDLGAIDIPKNEFDSKWTKLFESLDKEKIRYTKNFGILSYLY